MDGSYAELLALFEEWRAFERPALRRRCAGLHRGGDGGDSIEGLGEPYSERLHGNRARVDWPIEQQVDHHIVRAEMNGLDFNIRVLKPWARDPGLLPIGLDVPE